MGKRLILGLAGFSGTGKTTAATYLAQQHGFLMFEGSTLMRQIATKRGIHLRSRSTYEEFMRRLQHERGLSWISDTLLATPEKRILQVGLRSPNDSKNIHRAGGKVIGLACPAEICITRLDSGHPKNAITLEEYFEHQHLENSDDEYGSHTAEVVAHADYLVDTSKSLQDTYASLDAIVEEMLG